MLPSLSSTSASIALRRAVSVFQQIRPAAVAASSSAFSACSSSIAATPSYSSSSSHVSVRALSSSASSTSTAAPASPAANKDEVKHWALHYTYVPNVFTARVPYRAAHLQLAASWKATGKMLQGGAYTEEPMGALLTFYTTRSEMQKFIDSDPYVQNKIVTSYQLREWTVVIGPSGNPNYPGVEQIKVGDSFPKGLVVYENSPAGVVQLDTLFKGRRCVVFAVPGAFTPGCSKTHLPGYIKDSEKMKGKGVDEIICLAINDPFVMAAWGEQQGASGKVRMLADTTGDVTKRLGLAINLSDKLGSVRSKRWSMIVKDGVVEQLNVEPAETPTGLTCSLSSALKL